MPLSLHFRPFALLLIGALALLFASGCDSLAPSGSSEADEAPASTAGETPPPLEWSLVEDAPAQANRPGESNAARTCSGRARLPEQAEKTWRPFKARLQFPRAIVESAGDSTRTRTFKMRASEDPDSRLLLEATCQFPATEEAQRRVSRTLVEVREQLLKRPSNGSARSSNASADTSATVEGQPNVETPAKTRAGSSCRVERRYYEPDCTCTVTVYDCSEDRSDDDGGGGGGGGGCTQGTTPQAATSCSDDPGDGTEEPPENTSGPCSSGWSQTLNSRQCEKIRTGIDRLRNHGNDTCRWLGDKASGRYYDGDFRKGSLYEAARSGEPENAVAYTGYPEPEVYFMEEKLAGLTTSELAGTIVHEEVHQFGVAEHNKLFGMKVGGNLVGKMRPIETQPGSSLKGWEDVCQ